MNKLIGTTLVSICLAAASALPAYAAAPQDTRPAPAFNPAKRFAERPFSRPTERVEARLAYIKTALKITPAQEAQWDAYAAVARKDAKDLEHFVTSKRFAEARARRERASAVERLERAQTFHAEMVTRINELLAVEKPLYAALTPQQRKVADVVLNRRPHRFGGWHGRGGFGRG